MEHKFIAAKDFTSDNIQPAYIYKNIWKENTICLLHASREIDKTAMALDIVNALDRREKEVLYINVDGKLANRNIRAIDGLYVFTPEYESPDDNRDYAELVFQGIEQAVKTTKIRTFVIDSVSRIAALSFGRNASVAYIMKRLVALQLRCKISILVIAHEMTKATERAVTGYADSMITPSGNETATTKAGQTTTKPAQSKCRILKATDYVRELQAKQSKNQTAGNRF